MKTNFQMLRELLKEYHPNERGFMSEREYNLVTDMLCINEMNILQLSIL